MKHAIWGVVSLVLASCSLLPTSAPSSLPASPSRPYTTGPSINSVEAPKNKHQIQREREWKYLEDIKPYRGFLSALHDSDRGWKRTPEATIDAFAKIDGIAPLLDLCPTYKDFKIIGTRHEPYEQPARACDLAARHKALAQKAYLTSADDAVAGHVASVKANLATLSSGGVLSQETLIKLLDLAADPSSALAELRATIEPLYAALGQPVPTDRFAANVALGAEVTDAIRASIRAVEIEPARKRDAGVEKAVRDSFRAPARVRSVRIAWKEWNEIFADKYRALPTARLIMAFAYVQYKGEDFCRVYPVEARTARMADGWSSNVETNALTYRIFVARCP
jgi:hypothetical protein